MGLKHADGDGNGSVLILRGLLMNYLCGPVRLGYFSPLGSFLWAKKCSNRFEKLHPSVSGLGMDETWAS
jgi:hypothetical protein